MKMTIKNDKIILSFDLDYTLINNTQGIKNSFKNRDENETQDRYSEQ